MEGLGLGLDELIEILSTYTATDQAILAVDATPGWYVVGAFRMRSTFEILLNAVVSVSDPSLTLRARLFDMTAKEPVASIHLATQSMIDVFVQSGAAVLEGLHVYQMQVEVTGDEGEAFFGSVKAMNLAAANTDG